MRRKFERYPECHAVGNAAGNVLRLKLMCVRHEFCRFSKRDAPNNRQNISKNIKAERSPE
jgi:NAD(P)H-nitrite reductase large subunit